MSRHVAALVYSKKIGSMARKSILAYCAERANDDGSGMWASKLRIAKEVECSKQTVIDTFKAFVLEGVLLEVGKRKTTNGFVFEYDLSIHIIKGMEDAVEDKYSVGKMRGPDLDGSNELTPRGQATGPQEVKPLDPNRPLTVPEPSIGDDLFGSGASEQSPCSANVDLIKDGFDKFWAMIWPVHFRKSGKTDCFKVYRSACDGDHPKSEKISPEALNDATRHYIASVKDMQYLSGPLPWLRKPGWEPFLDGGGPSGGGGELTYAQRVALEYGGGRK